MPARSTDQAITFEDHGTFVRCRYTGPFAVPDLLDAARRITVYSARHGAKRVLMDIRGSAGDMTVEDRYVIANNMNYQFSRAVRLALWGRPDQQVADRVGEKALLAHGLSVRGFTRQTEALRWLLEPAS